MDTSALFKVDGMVAVVTGGGSGIGLMIAKALVGAGAKTVYILGRREAALNTAATAHPNIRPLVCDVSSKESLQAAVEVVTTECGYVNLVVANSGSFGPYQSYNPELSIGELRKSLFDDVAVKDFNSVFSVNVTGAYFTMFAFLELLDAGNKNALKGGFGAPLNAGSKVPSIQSQVVVTASLGSFSRERGTPPGYGSAKAAVAQLAQHAATNLAPYQIRVNTLAPGWFWSEMSDGILNSRGDPEDEAIDHPLFMPARRYGTEAEMGGTILYLASMAGAYCNGLILANDGGRLAVVPSTY